MSDIAQTTRLTHDVISPPIIDALRSYSLVSAEVLFRTITQRARPHDAAQ